MPREVKIIREWDAETFHKQVTELEAQGYIARPGSYHVIPEMNPETGEVSHLRLVEMVLPTAEGRPSSD